MGFKSSFQGYQGEALLAATRALLTPWSASRPSQTSLPWEAAGRSDLMQEIDRLQEALAQARAELVSLRAVERRARHQAQHDALTTLPSRGFFRERLDQALGQDTAKDLGKDEGAGSGASDGVARTDVGPQQPALALLYLDLDGFKSINDVHGHATGDILLRIVATRLTRAVRRRDMVGRLGGDEFVCLLSGLPDGSLGAAQLARLACKLFDAVSAPVRIGDLALTVQPSIGIARCPAHGTTSPALLQHADAAMYRAKRTQCGHAFYDPALDGAL